MAGDVVIRAEGLGKKYLIGHRTTERASTLRDGLTRSASKLFGATRDLLRGNPIVGGDMVEDFWALRDVDFEIRQGDVVGVIGRNGAGKSTLLKILSRITQPTEGRVEITGRVASLLEVGTGFHPELSGRENVFLNGAILGMGRAEIRRKFDEIVAFAEIDKFIDTPVKRYSSGMQVRLAFAVAAHLDPEILIVDEVLAVGDAEFQKKCLGKMHDVAGHGRTVLFVSHQLGMVSRLCDKGMHMSRGRLLAHDSLDVVMDGYLTEIRSKELDRSSRVIDSQGPYISNIFTMDDNGTTQSEFYFGQAVVLRVTINGPVQDPTTTLVATLVPRSGDYILSEIVELADRGGRGGEFYVDIRFPPRMFAPKDFAFRVALTNSGGHVFDIEEIAAPFKISDDGSRFSKYEKFDYGYFILDTDVTIGERR